VKSLAAQGLGIEHLDLGDPAHRLLELSGHRAVRVHHPSRRRLHAAPGEPQRDQRQRCKGQRGDRHLPRDGQQVADCHDQHDCVDERREEAAGQKALHTRGFGRYTLDEFSSARPGEEIQGQRLEVVVDALPDVHQKHPFDLCANPSVDEIHQLSQ
jgi:hypothetical protein